MRREGLSHQDRRHGPTMRCECEHEKHFKEQAERQGTTLPCSAGHAYGVDFPQRHIEPVRTVYGTFALCPACRETCHADSTVEAVPRLQVVLPSDVITLVEAGRPE